MNLDRSDLLVPLRVLAVFLIIIGVVYHGAIWAVGMTIWPQNTQGSPVTYEGEVVGSRLIAQDFNGSQFFHPRPSSRNYDVLLGSSSADLAPNNPKLTKRVRADLRNISDHPVPDDTVPVVLVSESGSAVDPHLTPAAARYQVPRISNATGIPEARLYEMIENATIGPYLGVWGGARVNVLELNIMVLEELEERTQQTHRIQQNATSQRTAAPHNQFKRGDH